MGNHTLQYMEHDITLHPDTGKPWCRDLDLQDDTVEGLKQKMRDLQKARESRPSIEVWVEGEKYSRSSGSWRKVKTKLAPVGRGNETWITWKNGRGQLQREQRYFTSLYHVSENNDAIIAQLLELNKQRMILEAQISELEGKLTNYEVPGEE
jgi:hypothetical protein